MRRAAILLVGDELLCGEVADTNGAWMAGRLRRFGIGVERMHTILDGRATIAREVRDLLGGHDLLVISGGLGPTQDDLTREGVADGLGVILTQDAATLEKLQRFFAARGFDPMPEPNRKQALFPSGCALVPNLAGTAPGFSRPPSGAAGGLVALPGVPSELRPMFEMAVEPLLGAWFDDLSPADSPTLHLFGIPESELARRASDAGDLPPGFRLRFRARGGPITLSLEGPAGAPEPPAWRTLAAGLARWTYSRDEPDLEQVVGQALLDRGQSVATAESCTGGLVGELLTRVPGISTVYREGVIAYANQAKVRLLGVDPDLLAEHGAVSEPAARAMAEGVRARAGSDWGISVTGIAGPDGGTSEKPVGLVFLGIAWQGGSETRRLQLPGGDRRRIRTLSALGVLNLLRRKLTERARSP